MRLARWSLLVILLVPLASAHADPVDLSPAPGASVAADAQLVRVAFSEPIVAGLSCVEARSAGSLLARTCAPAPGETRDFVVAVPAVERGVVEVSWRVLGLDGHVREGSYAYAVAQAAPSAVTLAPAPWEGRALGGALAMGAAVSLGVPVFARRSGARAAASRIGVAGAALAAGAGALALASTADALGTGTRALIASFPGAVLASQIALLAIAGALLVRGRVERGAGFAAAALALSLLTSHAIVGDGGPWHSAHVGLAVIAVHVGAGALWIGAVAGLALARGDDAAALAARARRWARVAVVAVALSGAGLALLSSTDPRALFSGGFGALFAAKLVIFSAALAFGALHERRFRHGDSPTRAALAVEAALLATALLAGGALAATPT